jgi:hypothetical protein
MPRALVTAALVGAVAIACSQPPAAPLQLEGNWLTIENTTAERWSGIEVWLNTYYRFTIPSMDPGGRYKVALDSFVAAYGQRFDRAKAPVSELRLTATRPDGSTYELKTQPAKGGLAGALEGLGGKR